jgi:elongation factor P
MGQRGEEILVDGIALAVNPLFLVHLHFEAQPLLGGIRELAETVGELHAADIKLETLGQARIGRHGTRQGRLAAGIFAKDRRLLDAEPRLDGGDQNLAEDVGPGVILRDIKTGALGPGRQRVAVSLAGRGQGGHQVDAGVIVESFGNRQALQFGARITAAVFVGERGNARGVGSQLHDGRAILDRGRVGLAGAIPFQHGEFGNVKRSALAVAEDPGEIEDAAFARRQQLLGGEFGRSVQVKRPPLPVRAHGFGGEGGQMRLVARRYGQGAALDFHEIPGLEPGPDGLLDPPADKQGRTAVDMPLGRPPRGRLGQGTCSCYRHPVEDTRFPVVAVIASSVRKGNVLEKDGKLYVVLKADSFHPGKGTPTTTIDMRRISDGVKVVDRYKTTDSVEKAFVEEKKYNYLYQDGDHYVFMDPVHFDQLPVDAAVVGDWAPYLQENMEVTLSLFNGTAVSIVLPQRVTLEVTETEPVVKGQTASGSFKPALLSNGVRTMVPTHIVPGTRVVVMTEDGSYSERAKD